VNGSVAPVCPVSYSGYPSIRALVRGGDSSGAARPGTLHDQINSIPRAHDLLSAIRALNIMNNIITQITIGEPQINNVYPLGGGGVILKGDDNNPGYFPADWIQEERHYRSQKLYNPDDEEQFVEIKILTSVTFFNPNTDYRLIYEEPRK